mmetsp:Transcript_36064/g.57764  ORF Transcript_36064/g.57764 Transcript_36064/m.57764 type:complete len:1019 (+) Transcript_36064:337-3393(+)
MSATLLAKFKLVDAALCFVIKAKIPCKVKSVCRIANNLGGDVDLQTLRALCALVPQVFRLAYNTYNLGDTGDVAVTEVPYAYVVEGSGLVYYLDFEIMKKFRGASKSAILKRKKAVENAFKANDQPGMCALPQAPITVGGDGVSDEVVAAIHPLLEPQTGALNFESILQSLKACPFYEDQLCFTRRYKGRPMRTKELVASLHPGLLSSLNVDFGIKNFYTHQASAINAIRQGADVIVSTSTSSGKSMIFNVPVFQDILEGKRATALYLFPTKALSQDQLGSCRKLAEGVHRHGGSRLIQVNTYDGDTEQCERENIRVNSDIIITNPDMLHVSILPSHRAWVSFLSSLRYIVIDEAHMYCGMFGSHVGAVLSRLRRVVSAYGAQLQFLCFSATIGNPESLFQKLIPSRESKPFPVKEDEDGSLCGRRLFGIWNPPETEGGKRKSAIFETALLLSALTRMGLKTLAFCRTRKLTELVLRYTHEQLANGYGGVVYGNRENHASTRDFQSPRPHLVPAVAGYRGGYQKEERREIENKLFSGQLQAVTATCALELGIDVGHLDAVVLLGYPGSAASMWQQVGRAGRSGKDSLALMVCHNGPVDQFFVKHPERLLDISRVEDAVLDPLNKYVLQGHVPCALREKPLSPTDYKLFGQDKLGIALKKLISDDIIVDNGAVVETHPKLVKPFNNVSLRVIDPVTFQLIFNGQVLDTIPYQRAFFEVYPGAIYMHQGKSYIVTNLDIESHTAKLTRSNVSYYTKPRDQTDVVVDRKMDSRTLAKGPVVNFGGVGVVKTVWGYSKVWLRNAQVFEKHEFTLPPIEFQTQAVWLDLSSEIQLQIRKMTPEPATKERQDKYLRAGIHAVNHLLKTLLPMFVLCDVADIDTEHTGVMFKRPQPPRLLLYDSTPGGLGACEAAFDHMLALLQLSLRILKECNCQEDDGCVSCTNDLRCPEYNTVLSKIGGIKILEMLLEGVEVETTKRARSPTTPQRKRARAMEKAKGMGKERLKQLHIQKPWAPSCPNHYFG